MLVREVIDNCWVLISSVTNQRVGLVTKKDEKYNLIQDKSRLFDSLEQICTSYYKEDFNLDIPSENEEQLETKVDIGGYPIKPSHGVHNDEFIEWWDNVNKEKTFADGIHTYNKLNNSDVVYVAGYFAIKFSKGYVTKMSPKLRTLKEYDFIGPFQKKIELIIQVRKFNR